MLKFVACPRMVYINLFEYLTYVLALNIHVIQAMLKNVFVLSVFHRYKMGIITQNGTTPTSTLSYIFAITKVGITNKLPSNLSGFGSDFEIKIKFSEIDNWTKDHAKAIYGRIIRWFKMQKVKS